MIKDLKDLWYTGDYSIKDMQERCDRLCDTDEKRKNCILIIMWANNLSDKLKRMFMLKYLLENK